MQPESRSTRGRRRMKYAARRLLAQPGSAGGRVAALVSLRRSGARRFLSPKCASNAASPPRAAEALRARHGLDRPLPVRYAAWLGSWRAANSATRWPTTAPSGPLLRQRIPGTLLLTATATLLAWLMAIPLGIWNAADRGTVERFAIRNIAFDPTVHPRISIGDDSARRLPSKPAGFRPAACTRRDDR